MVSIRSSIYLIAIALVAWLAMARSSNAQSACGWTLRVDRADEGCATLERLRDRVVERAGRDLFVSARAPATRHLRVEIHGEAGVRTFTVEVTGEDGRVLGRRSLELTTETCGVVDDALVFLIAAVIAEVESPLVEVEPVHVRTAPDRTAPDTRERVPLTRPDPPRRRMDLMLGGSAAVAQFPDLAGGFSVGVEFELAPVWPVFVETAWRGQPTRAAPGGRVSFWQLAAAIGACPRAFQRERAIELSVCGALQGAWIRAAGHDYAFSRSADLFQLDVRLGLRMLLTALEPFVAALEVGAWVPLLRDRFLVEPIPSSPLLVHEPSWVVGYATVNLGVRVGL